MVSAARKPQRSVTVVKRKESPKKILKKTTVAQKRSKSKSPVKTQMRKRDQKAARKADVKVAKATKKEAKVVKRSASVVQHSRSKSLTKAVKPDLKK